MRRLPKIMFATGATIIVVVALLVSALRMMLPLINEYRPQIVAKIQSVSGIPLDVGFMQGTWKHLARRWNYAIFAPKCRRLTCRFNG